MTEDFSNINRASNFIFLFRSIEASVYAGMFILCFLFASIGNLFAQNLEVSGIVKDDKGEPLLGVFVLIKGTQRGASTDLDGHYTLHTKVGDVLLFLSSE